ncbi:uncharacterized protein LOC112509404 isoform X1 [Cynara cardunculus var. scolymus]|uniref:uncharacterized protein LOC112509404 isoform X1 n=1 Tax=Cynara cardunculus var. scolymus TaxID=59895 RepID=UPI000D628835|nr:uncharacterized protein LOC112509404 isoform X1 [Cynara cardunculus var. scolymus]
MALLVRPLILSPVSKWPLRRCINSISDSKLSNFSTGIFKYRPFFTGTSPSILIHRKNLHLSRSRGLRPADAPLPSEVSQRDSESDSSDAAWKSRNEKKREARRGVRWAMQLADFNDSQIKRILRIASLEEEVFDALMLVKRLGRDVREGKRRQFSYIGRLLRDVQPELMDGLIQATKDGDQQKLLELSGSDKLDLGETGEEEGETEDEDDDEEGFGDYHDIATRWFDGLVNKDVDIANEIYSLSTVEFDRQELRKLVRNFCSMQDRNATTSEEKVGTETDVGLSRAKRHLTRFLVALAKQLPTEENYTL